MPLSFLPHRKSGKMIWLRWPKVCPWFLGTFLSNPSGCRRKIFSRFAGDFTWYPWDLCRKVRDSQGKERRKSQGIQIELTGGNPGMGCYQKRDVATGLHNMPVIGSPLWHPLHFSWRNSKYRFISLILQHLEQGDGSSEPIVNFSIDFLPRLKSRWPTPQMFMEICEG